MRSLQRRALRRELGENAKVLDARIRKFTSKKMYDASNTMNAAFATYHSWLLDDASFRQAYLRTPYYQNGERIAKPIWESEDKGQPQDIETINRWAKQLEISSWFEWVLMEESELEIRY